MSLKCLVTRNYGQCLMNHMRQSSAGVKTSTSIFFNATPKETPADEEEFRTLELQMKRPVRQRRTQMVTPILPPRYKRQKIDQNWGNVWPAARTFHPASVPLPIRQGYPASGQPTPDKWGNAELMKIPNFLHLTPPVIQRQCEALKKINIAVVATFQLPGKLQESKEINIEVVATFQLPGELQVPPTAEFCTPWPVGLETPAKQEKHFPVTVQKTTYLHSSPSIRDPKARIVTYKVSLKSLDLDSHSRDKLLRLVGNRYDPNTDYLTLVADRCPLSQQNYDYCRYLLTVIYAESKKKEPWENEKEVVDREAYIWEGSPSQVALKAIDQAKVERISEEVVNEYKQVVSDLHNEGEDMTTVSRYRDSVLKVIGLA